MRKLNVVCLLILSMTLGMWVTSRSTQAQTPTALQIISNQPHTSCTVSAVGSATYCFAVDGLWESLNGAAYVSVSGSGGGVTSVTVCNAAGASCGAAQTGAVSLSIPKSVTVTAPTVTATAPTATLQ